MLCTPFVESPTHPLVFLVPSTRKDVIKKEYLDPFGIPINDVLLINLRYSQTKKKTPVKEMREFVNNLLVDKLTHVGAKYLVVCDADYYKVLTGERKAEANLGYVKDCIYGPWKVVYAPNHRTIFYDPEGIRAKISQSMEALLEHVSGSYVEPGEGIIKYCAYPQTEEEIEAWLEKLLEMECDLAVDIEAFSLKHHDAGIGTIAFSWNQHEGVAFPVDYRPIPGATQAPFGEQVRNEKVRELLRNFFSRFKKKAYYHNIAYDAYVLIYQLYMKDLLDTEGLLHGMKTLLNNWDDTRIITYLATNSCAGNKLSLKDQAQEFAGNYAQDDIKDIRNIPLNELLQYNLVDTLSTWFVYHKHWDTLVADDQLDIYNTIFKPATLDVIQMQLTGLPVNIDQVRKVNKELEAEQQAALEKIQNHPIIQDFVHELNNKWVIERNSILKRKKVTLEDANESFNPNSSIQLRDLLYHKLGLPVLRYTKNKQPSTEQEVLESLQNHAEEKVKDLIQYIIEYKAVNKIISTFMPPLLNSVKGPDDWHYLFGNFNLGGTVSGRLSSSNPNLQNLPSGSKYAKAIKSCIQAPPGWVMVGLDFDSLEDKISGLTTKDYNKLKVYIDGYEGHSFRAFTYYRELMPDIEDTVESINSIKTKYKTLRDESKGPTFALTYQGTWQTLMDRCGFSEEKAKQIEARYRELYKVSIEWVNNRLNEASRDGYITLAFGLRLRTPLLHQVVRGTSRTPHEAEAEGRTAGNALGQSWCLLNSRASIEFMGKVRESKYRLDIRPCAQIHDAQYYMVRDNIDIILYTNKHLVEAAYWQDHPDIYHDKVKLGGTLTIFFPSWASEIEIPKEADEETLIKTVYDFIGVN